MAPEIYEGNRGDEQTDQFALGVTLARLFGGGFPYGEAEAFSRPRFGKLRPPSASRDDLPAWLDDVVARAVAVAPADRFGDENGRAHVRTPVTNAHLVCRLLLEKTTTRHQNRT